MERIFGVECTCKEGEEYPDGTAPLFFTDGEKAFYWYRKLKSRVMYWCVHLDGLRLVGKLK